MSQDNQQENKILTSRPNRSEIQSQIDQFKLPKLAAPPSRGQTGNKKQNKTPLRFPSINDDNIDYESEKNFRNTEVIHVSRSQNDIMRSQNHSVQDDFGIQTEERLKILMGHEQNKTNEANQDEEISKIDELSDDHDFQQKIRQNKEIIKMHRKKNQQKPSIAKPLEAFEKIPQGSNKLKFSNKPQSNYDKKMKDYNFSLENKYLQRKKESLGIIPEKPQKALQKAKSKKIIGSYPDAIIEAKINDVKANFGYKQFKNNVVSKSQTKQTSRPLALLNGINKAPRQPAQIQSSKQPKNQRDKPNKQASKTQQQQLSPSKRINRTSNLFDNIQSFLQNPIAGEKHDRFYKQLIRKLKSKNIQMLQEKIKQIDEKLTESNENFRTTETLQQKSQKELLQSEMDTMERTVRDWKRLDINDKNKLKYKQSDFQKQLDYISYLQEKSSSSLSKFIDHEKMMIELQINKRFSKSINKERQDVKEGNVS